ncbi:MAG: DUF488 domain-containing protein [Tepidisphaeraceae bacterium]|jgi:uncharacterized protein (DUF488 family)
MAEALNPIFTVGHSTHEWEPFVGLLLRHRIQVVADVRSQPFSRIPHFNRDALAAALKARGIAYVQMGRELGARRDERECYVDGQAVYERVAELPLFRDGIRRLANDSRERVIALMCSEKEPLDCHRTVLICRRLKPHGMPIRHILADGTAEDHAVTEDRLMRLMGIEPEQGDLFTLPQDLLEQAYEARGKEIAYCGDMSGTRRDARVIGTTSVCELASAL